MMIKAAVVGLGQIAWYAHCPYLAKSDNFQLLGVYDMVEVRLQKTAQEFNTKAYFSYCQLLEDPEVDLVIITTPPSSHAELAVQALNSGKNVIVDKPMCLSVVEADKMIEAAQKNKKMLSVFQNRRWDADYLTVKKTIESGLLGDIFVFESRVMGYGIGWARFGVPEFRPQWRTERAYGGGQSYDWGAHLIDQLLQVVNSPAIEVFGDLQSRLWSKEVDDHFKSIIRFENGIIAQIEASNNARISLPRWYIIGSKGTLLGDWETFRAKVETNGIEGEFIPDLVGKSGSPREGKWEDYYTNIYEVLVEGKELLVRAADVRKVIQIIEASHRSSDSKQVIKLQ